MKISVCMASYNGAKYIKEQLDSILSQLNEYDELIISDDGSIDCTVDIIRSYDDSRIKLLHNKKNGGIKKTHVLVANNFENALKNAKGDIIFLSDQDDVWMANKVKLSLNYLKVNDLVISDCYYILNNEIDYNSSHRKGISPIRSFWGKLHGVRYQGCCIAFNRSVLQKVLPFPKNTPLHDGWIGLIAEYSGNVFFLNERLIAYRLHGDNVSKGKNMNSLFYKIKYRVILFYNVFNRIKFQK